MWEVYCYTYLPCVASSEVDPVSATHSCVSLACLLWNTATPPYWLQLLNIRTGKIPVPPKLLNIHFLPPQVVFLLKRPAEANVRGVVKRPPSHGALVKEELTPPILLVYS